MCSRPRSTLHYEIALRMQNEHHPWKLDPKMRRPRSSSRCIHCDPERPRRRPISRISPFHALVLLHLHNNGPTNPPRATATQSSPHPYRITLPDSTQSPPIHLIGSPAHSQTADENGYAVLVDPKDGYVKYAAVDDDGRVVPTKFKMLNEGNTLDPAKVYGLEPMVMPSEDVKREECGEYCVDEWERYEWRESGENDGCEIFCLDGGVFRRLAERFGRWLGRNDRNRSTKLKPTIQPKTITPSKRSLLSNNKLINLVIPIKFANHASRPTIPQSNLSTLFNSPSPVADIAPTGSVREYFKYNSYGSLIVESTVVDWIRVKNTEQYYAGKKSGLSGTFHDSLVEALNKLDSDPSFDFKDYDKNGDGVIDSIFFLHSGYSAEWGGVDCINGNDRSNRIWSHKWKIGKRAGHGEMGWVSKSGVRVDEYAVSSALFGVCGNEIARIGTIAHEMARLFGLPSLYGGDAPHGGNGIGSFGLMGNSWGWDGSQYYPPLLSPWSKMELGWLQPVTILSSGVYSLPPVGSDPKVFKIDLGREDEFLLLENRAATSFDSMIPKSGLVIWHIDNRAPHYVHDNLISPTSSGSNAHYRVSLVSADGNFDMEGGVNRGDESDFFGSNHTLGIGFTGEHTTYPNSDSYRDGVVKPSGIRISSISDPEDDPDGHIKFTVLFPGDAPVPDTTAPSPDPTPKPDLTLVQKSLTSTFGANTGSTGVMFDVVAINSVDITALDLHLRSGIDDGEKLIEVYVKSGTHVDNTTSSEDWGKVCCSKKIVGNGVAKRTTLDSSNFFRKISIAEGERMALYVTSDEPIIRYSSSSKACCEIFVSSLDLQIYEGTGVGSYPFGPSSKSPRIFNGAIHYETKEDTNKNTDSLQYPVQYSPELVKTATSTYFSGNSGGFGITFDVIPKKDMAITSLDFHTDLEEIVEVSVWTRTGSHVGHERDQLRWESVCMIVNVVGQGPHKPTPIDQSQFRTVKLNAFERASFYVTLSTPNMRYTRLKEGTVSVGDVSNDLPDIRVLVGSGIAGFPFGHTIPPRLWNGSIKYVLTDEPTPLNKMVPTTFAGNSTSEIQHLTTTFASGNKGYGVMFDVSNTEGAYAVITSIDFHTDLVSDIKAIVYTKEGSFVASEFKPDDWMIISDTTVTGQGYFKRTSIPTTDFQEVSVPNGNSRGFYVSIDQAGLLYSDVDGDRALGDIWSQSNGIRIHIGSGLQGAFSTVFQPRIFNGGIHYYHVHGDSSLAPESVTPTVSPKGDKYKYETPMDGESGSFGIMFTIRSKNSNSIYVRSLAFHTDLLGDCAVEIYTLSGEYKGKEQIPTEWTKVSNATVQTYGMQSWSEAPKMQPVQILPDLSQSFYVTLERPNLKYSLHNGTDSQIEPLGDKYIEVYGASGVGGYPFGLSISPRIPEIRIEYEVATS